MEKSFLIDKRYHKPHKTESINKQKENYYSWGLGWREHGMGERTKRFSRNIESEESKNFLLELSKFCLWFLRHFLLSLSCLLLFPLTSRFPHSKLLPLPNKIFCKSFSCGFSWQILLCFLCWLSIHEGWRARLLWKKINATIDIQ